VLGERAPDAVPGYAAMARLTAGRALSAGRITPGQAAPLVDVLAEAESPATRMHTASPESLAPRVRAAATPAPDVITARVPGPRRPG
jgi:hypothetical protein